MTTEDKLMVHLEHIVMPIGIPLNAIQQLDLCDRADYAQRIRSASQRVGSRRWRSGRLCGRERADELGGAFQFGNGSVGYP